MYRTLVNPLKMLLFIPLSLFLSAAAYANLEKVGAMADDMVVTGKITVLYAQDPLISPFQIGVTTKEGEVSLSGMVDTDMQYERAVMLAESVDGVKDVTADELKVKDSDQPMTDILITAKVKGKILKEKLFSDKDLPAWPVSIETKNGAVYLSGQVDSLQQKDNILRIVHGVSGVVSVEDGLTVGDSQDD